MADLTPDMQAVLDRYIGTSNTINQLNSAAAKLATQAAGSGPSATQAAGLPTIKNGKGVVPGATGGKAAKSPTQVFQDTATAAQLKAIQKASGYQLNGVAKGALGGFIDTSKALSKIDPLGNAVSDKLATDLMQHDKTGAQAPQNATQWIMNLLAGGTYVAGEGLKSAAEHSVATHQNTPDGGVGSASLGDRILDTPGNMASYLPGFAKGVAEAFGARFDNKTPETPGKYIFGEVNPVSKSLTSGSDKPIGTLIAGNQPNGPASGEAATRKFLSGLPGFGADIVLDPLSYAAPGAGGIKDVAAGIARGAGEAIAKAGAEGGKAGILDVAKAAVQGGRDGHAAYLAAADAAGAAKANAKALLSANKGNAVGEGDVIPLAEANLLDSARLQAPEAPVAEHLPPEVQAPAPDTAAPAASVAAAAEPRGLTQALKLSDEPVVAPHENPIPVAPNEDPLAAGKGAVPAAPVALAPTTPMDRVKELLPSLSTVDRTPVASSMLRDATTSTGSSGMSGPAFNLLQLAKSDPARLPEAMKQLRATPEGAAFLKRTITVQQKPMTMEGVLVKHAQTGDAGTQALMGHVLDQVMKRVQPGADRTVLDPQTLLSNLGTHGLGDDAASSLLAKVVGAKEADRPGIISQALGLDAHGFGSFGDAIDAAAQGQVDSGAMRQMLKALGVPTKATTELGLAKALGSRGKLTWENLQASIPTEAEVLVDHGIEQSASDAAKTVDTSAVADAAAKDAGEQLSKAELLQHAEDQDAGIGADFAAGETTNPLSALGPDGISSRFRPALKRYLEKIQTVTPHNVERVSRESWNDAWRSAVNTMNLAPNLRRLSGAARADAMTTKVLSVLTAMESLAKSHGVMPFLKLNKNDAPLYLSVGDMMSELQSKTVQDAFFSINNRLAAKGSGTTDAARAVLANAKSTPAQIEQAMKTLDAHARGATVYPTTLGVMVKRALAGGSEKEIFDYAKGGASAFEKSTAGQKALKAIARDLSDPGVQARLKNLADSQEVIALAFMHKAADQIIAPLAAKFINVIGTYGDRGAVNAAVHDIIAQIGKVSPTEETSLLRDLIKSRSDNGILRALGPDGVALMRHDQITAAAGIRNATEKKAMERSVAAKTKRSSTDAADQATRRATVDAKARLSEDAPEEFDERLGYTPDPEDTADLVTIAQRRMDMRRAGIFGQAASFGDHMGERLLGRYGAQNVKPIYEAAHGNSLQESSAFVDGRGGLRDLALGGNGVQGWLPRMEQALGRKVEYSELNASLADIWTILAAHLDRFDLKGADVTPELLDAALGGGARKVRGNALLGPVRPLEGWEIDTAHELMRPINEVFTHKLERAGLASKDLNATLGRQGVDTVHRIQDESVPTGGQTKIWRTYDAPTLAERGPINMLAAWHRAIEQAQLPYEIAGQIKSTFSHVGEGLTREQALAQGYKGIKVSPNSRMSQLLGGDHLLYSQRNFEEIARLDRTLDLAQQTAINNKALARIVAGYDAATGVMKGLNTVWNPSHHIDNILGENGMLLLNGINPIHNIRAMKIMARNSMLSGDVDPILKDLALRQYNEATPELKPGVDRVLGASGDGKVTIRMVIGNKVVQMNEFEAMALAKKYAIPLTHRDMRDQMGLTGSHDVLGNRFIATFQRLNPYSRATEKLGVASAARDNITRLTHFFAVLERKQYRSVDEAGLAAAAETHMYHPSVESLSPFEQKYLRRVVYFYTWAKTAATAITEKALEHPAIVTVPSKFQYEQSVAAGFNPSSIGQPVPQDDRIATYETSGLYGPTFTSGYSPLGGAGDLPPNELPHLWGYSLSAPQMDALGFLWGQSPLTGDPVSDAASGLNEWGQQLNPLIQGVAGAAFAGAGKVPTTQQAVQGAFKSSGAPYRLAAGLGLDNKYSAQSSATPEQQAQVDAENAGNNARVLTNWLTGAKFTDYTNDTSAAVENTARRNAYRARLVELGFAPDVVTQLMHDYQRNVDTRDVSNG